MIRPASHPIPNCVHVLDRHTYTHTLSHTCSLMSPLLPQLQILFSLAHTPFFPTLIKSLYQSVHLHFPPGTLVSHVPGQSVAGDCSYRKTAITAESTFARLESGMRMETRASEVLRTSFYGNL